MRLFISMDMEGVAGVITENHCRPEGFDYDRARQWMTDELVAACEGAITAGVEEIVVADSHGPGHNIIPDRLPENVILVCSFPRPLMMVEGIQDGHFDGAMLLGYHANRQSTEANLAHTMMQDIHSVKINGLESSELLISAFTAGYFGIPIIMVSGDNALIEHASLSLDCTVYVQTKTSKSFRSARTLRPQDSCVELHKGAQRAVREISKVNPNQTKFPADVHVTLSNIKFSETLAWLPGVQRIDAHTIQLIAADPYELNGLFAFLVSMVAGHWK